MPNQKEDDLVNFAARWERIGLPPEQSTEDRPSSAASAPDMTTLIKSFTNVNNSIKLRSFPSRGASKKGTTQRAYRARRCEAGDPCRLLKELKHQASIRASSTGASRPDFLECVADGLQQNVRLAKNHRHGPRMSFRPKLPAAGAEESETATLKSQLKEAWGTSTLRRSSALNDMLSPAGRAERRMSKGRPVTLKDFKNWCVKTFGSIESAWSALDAKGQGLLARDEFVASLSARGFPMGELGGKTVFFFLDTGDSATINKEAVLMELSKIPDRHVAWPTGDSSVASTSGVSRSTSFSVNDSSSRQISSAASESNSVANHTKRLLELGFDVVEAQALGLQKPGVNVEAQLKKKMVLLREKDPILAQLLDFLYKAFGTLKFAFRQMDINGNGRLSKSEFENSMLKGVRSNAGVFAVDEHMQELFKRIDHRGSGALSLVEFVNILEKGDPLVERLAKFFMDASISKRAVGIAPGDQAKPDQGPRRERLERAFRAMGMSTGKAEVITYTVFVNLLTQLQYQEWHVRDLFHRLDTDGSGEITLTEFTAFLMPEAPVYKPKYREVVPMGSEARRQKVESGVSSMMASTKVDRVWSGHGRKISQTRSKEGSDSRPTSAVAGSDAKRSSFLHYARQLSERPDYTGVIRDSLKQMMQDRPHSEMRQRGHHCLRSTVYSEKQLPVVKCLEDFPIEHSRDRTESMARTEHW